ncbi:12677_t:CDS:2 [Entrophospora sp. SA101]|nr:12677_t:CDS:2 [Entrophospora sp. SA101]CAJ0907961.1 17512_t:CDS:2 [Entrophospora sp. SA101]
MRPTYNNINDIDNNHHLNLLNNPYMSNTTTHLTPHGFISLATANQYPIFNYPITINSNATRQSIFSVTPPTSSISRVAIPGSLIDNNKHTTKKESAKSSSSNDVPKNISTNQKTLLPKPLQETPTNQAAKLTADEDKRRRNTAASARFRVKKKLREKELERTAKEMTARTELLDERVKELEMENKWLRKLIVEKDAKLLLDVIDKNKDK